MMPLEQLVDKIVKETSNSKEDIEKMIEEKQDELSGLVSKEGAAYIVGRELGINLIKEEQRDLKIKNLVSGIRSVDMIVKIVKIFEPRGWEKGDKSGSVLNLVIGDETGKTKLALWNEDVQLVERLGLKEGDVIEISNARTRNGLDMPEVSLAKGGSIKKSEKEVDVLNDRPFDQRVQVSARVDIKYVKENSPVEVRGCLVQLFRRNPFYFVCSKCSGKVTDQEGKYICQKDGEVEVSPQLILTGVLDDGSGNIRIVFFRDMAEKVCGKPTKEMKRIFDKKGMLNGYDELDCLGCEFVVRGFAKKSDFSGEVEMIANSVEQVDPKKECELLLKSF